MKPATPEAHKQRIAAVFFVRHFFPRPRGAGYAALNLARFLRQEGVPVRFITGDAPAALETRSVDGFAVVAYRIPESGKLSKIISALRIARTIRRCGPSVVFHVHGGDYLNLFLARTVELLARVPSVVKLTSRGWDDPDSVRQGKYGRLALSAFRRLSAVVVMTNGQLHACRKYRPAGIIEVIPNGVDCDRFRPVSETDKRAIRASLNLPPDEPVLLYVGRLGYIKGTDRLFRIYDAVRRSFPSAWLVCAGDFLQVGDSRQKLAALLAELGLPEELAYLDRVKLFPASDTIERYFQMADLLIFPSRREGFGTVQIEAMACGLASVVSDLPGVTEDIFPSEEVGITIAGDNLQAYIDAVSRLLKSPEQRGRIGAAARRWVETAFSYKTVARRYRELYRKVLGY